MLIKIINFFLPTSVLSDAFKRENQVSIFTIIVMFSTTLFYAPYCYIMNMPIMALGCILTPVISLIALFIIKFKNNKRLASTLVCISTFFTITIAYYAGGLGSSPPIVWFFVFPVVVVILAGNKAAISWALFSVITIISFEVWRITTGHSFTEFTPFTKFYTNIINVTIGSAILVLFVGYSLKSKNEALENAQKLFEDKQKILSILFHDVSNLLHISLLKTSPLLFKKYTKDNLFEIEITKVNKSLSLMRELINHVQELESINSGKVEILLEDIHLDGLFEDIIFIFQDKLKEKELNLVFKGETNISILGNKTSLLNNVLSNFISNAIKFSPRGETIEITTEKFDENILLSIKDKGVGMSQNLINKLFDYDQKTNRKGTEGESGTGFGMPIAKSAIEKLGGALEISSKENDGTTFKITFKKTG